MRIVPTDSDDSSDMSANSSHRLETGACGRNNRGGGGFQEQDHKTKIGRSSLPSHHHHHQKEEQQQQQQKENQPPSARAWGRWMSVLVLFVGLKTLKRTMKKLNRSKSESYSYFDKLSDSMLVAGAAKPSLTGGKNQKQFDVRAILPPPANVNRFLNVPVRGTFSNTTYYVHNDIAVQQIEQYKTGTALILNVHVTHHAGTALCGFLGGSRSRGTHGKTSPNFACMGVSKKQANTAKIDLSQYPNHKPWSYIETAANIHYVRKYFHFISWEFSHAAKLAHTNWEDPNLVSIVVMRDPLSRLLAGDGETNVKYPGITSHKEDGQEASLETWWKFAKESKNTNNYALRVFVGPDDIKDDCCDDDRYLKKAQALLSRVTFVVDIDCLNDSLVVIADVLGVELNLPKHPKPSHHNHPSIEARIPHKEVLDFLKQKNRNDIALYEWSKERSIVKCANIPPK